MGQEKRTAFVNALLGTWQCLFIGSQVLHVHTLFSRLTDDECLGTQPPETMIQCVFSHVGAIAGDDFWAKSQSWTDSALRLAGILFMRSESLGAGQALKGVK